MRSPALLPTAALPPALVVASLGPMSMYRSQLRTRWVYGEAALG
jgi:hypothetical protein